MASPDHISDSEDSSDPLDLMRTPRKGGEEETALPTSALSIRFRGSPRPAQKETPRVRSSTSEDKKIEVLVQGPSRPWEYQAIVADQTVDEVLAEIDQSGDEAWYRVEFADGKVEDVSFTDLNALRNGESALRFYLNGSEDTPSEDSEMSPVVGNRVRKRIQTTGFQPSGNLVFSDDSDDQVISKKRRLTQNRLSRRSKSRANNDEDSDERKPSRRSSRHARSAASRIIDEVDELADDQDESEESEVGYQPKKSGLPKKRGRSLLIKGKSRGVSEDSDSSEPYTRKSGRDRGDLKSMKERHEDEEMFADEPEVAHSAKVLSIREIYPPISKQSAFSIIHSEECDICHKVGNASNKGISPLVFCQGCSTSIHRVCLGPRSTREHVVTKIGIDHFVLQCRRCIGLATKKDPSAPLLDSCQDCTKPGLSCAAFSSKKTAKQEEKLRTENDGEDPVTNVSRDLVNNAENTMFRCKACYRAWHFEHLPPLSDDSETPDDLRVLRELRIEEYSEGKCYECEQDYNKIQALIAWRPADRSSYEPDQIFEDFREDQREYLIKWADKSYSKASWMPGAWVWGTSSALMRKAFFSRDDNHFPRWTSEEAIPDDYLRMEIIFAVEYQGYSPRSRESDKKHINKVKSVKVKFLGLGYDQSVWEDPPSADDDVLWADYTAAFEEYLAGVYFKVDRPVDIKKRLEAFQGQKFTEFRKQPSALAGGEIFPYQLEGMNWLRFNYYKGKNVILADEMGLGKTIQVIAFIAALATQAPKCWPFLVVTPNSTCPNWRREMKKWAPTLRVVAYYGGKEARDMAHKYELFPDRSTDMRAHVVITSYDAIKDFSSFGKIKWTGLIVDEGQRLKNDENQLYVALEKMRFPFRALLTGTPLQNNKKELFNLLHFLDPSLDATELDEEYSEVTKENISELHDIIRPFLLRRTKATVLTLPPMSQTIIPVKMSSVQKDFYKSILEKNAALIAAILDKSSDKGSVKKKDRGNLNNILMQLRKLLCHPYVYNDQLEDQTLDRAIGMRRLIDYSSKFRLLEIMLPKLRERGHRVLIFSQFLDQLTCLEDFLDFLGLRYQRLDGKINALEKQRRIDEFNAPDSELFAFLLSTRAGGVGINLATADTVIVMDPDFNPHQDLQAVSRAHRLGQNRKVLVFSLMTKSTAEEKIVQIGRKKMALDKALIESIDLEDAADVDVESILKHGAQALFDKDDDGDTGVYTPEQVDALLDRSKIEDEKAEKGADSHFSAARIWVNEKGALTDDINSLDAEETSADANYWQKKAMAQKELEDAERKRALNLGRGMRQRNVTRYDSRGEALGSDDDGDDPEPVAKGRKRKNQDDMEAEFAGPPAAADTDDDSGKYDSGKDDGERIDVRELEPDPQGGRSRSIYTNTEPSRRISNSGQPQGSQSISTTRVPPPNHQQQSFQAAPFPVNLAVPSNEPTHYHGPIPAPILPPHRQRISAHPKYQAQQPRPPPNGYANSSFFIPPGPNNFPRPSNHGPNPLAGSHYSNVIPKAPIVPSSYGSLNAQSQHVRSPSQGDPPDAQHGLRDGIVGSGTNEKRCVGTQIPREAPLKSGQISAQSLNAEICNRCGFPHFEVSRKCPEIASPAKIRMMIDLLDRSTLSRSIGRVKLEHFRKTLKEQLQRRSPQPVKRNQ